jgi:ABC-type antimicrobial peptide transport system permease subunit
MKYLKKINLKPLYDNLLFLIILFCYLWVLFFKRFKSFRFFPKFLVKILDPITSKLHTKLIEITLVENSVSKLYLIELSINSLKFKTSRTIITIGGMSIGIAAIVFLVSIGFGLQEMVISRVARLEEMRQAEITTQPGSNLFITDETLKNIDSLPNVEHVLPLITLVGKVHFQGSISDVAVYGTTSEYLLQSAIRPIEGDIFYNEEIGLNPFKYPKNSSKVAGISTVSSTYTPGDILREVEFSINPDVWLRVRSGPGTDSKLLGLTKRVEGQQIGSEVLGGSYIDNAQGQFIQDSNGDTLGRWIKSNFYLWELKDGEYIPLVDSFGNPKQESGYVAQLNMDVPDLDSKNIVLDSSSDVLGLSTTNVSEASESTSSTSILTDDLLELGITAEDQELLSILQEEFSEDLIQEEVQYVDLDSTALKQAIVNRSMLKVLGIDEKDAVGQKINVSFIVTSSLTRNNSQKIESNLENYEIVGVVPQGDVPFFYVAFKDLKGLGIDNYSQAKVVVNDTSYLADTRKKIESMGYVSSSVTDTIAQINNLFATIKTVLGIIGAVALGVASLGMFNTLTVSLLERTREIGLMKALGMKSNEVRELFLIESMLMGIFSGILGIVFGVLAGELLGFLLSLLSITKGIGYVDISYVPLYFLLLVVLLSVFVGLVTGLYPAKRAKNISALDALRYE